MSKAVRLRNLVKRFEDTVVVEDVSFDIPGGTLTVLLGPSGCGKSTLLRMICGLEDPTVGTVTIGDQDVTRLDAARRGISMVFQSYALFPHLSVAENIVFGLKIRRLTRAEREARCAEAAEMVGLSRLLDRKPAQLSGGQKQRVALARAIVSEQPVCLMDEPLSNLDAKLRATMRDEICALQRRLGLTMVYVTHDQTEAMSMADQIVLLNDGHIEQIGSPADLYEHPATLFAARFIGLPPMNLLASEKVRQGGMAIPETGAPGAAWVGVRPEGIRLGPDGLPATISAVDYLGSETILRLKHDDGETMVRLPGKASATPGSKVRFGWQPTDVHLFDENGFRLGGG